MKTSRKATLFLFAALLCVSSQFVSHSAATEPEIANALEACSSLDQFSRWISDLTVETEASIRGKPDPILTRYAPTEGAIIAQEYLREQFYALGLDVETQDTFAASSNNVIARLPGTGKPDEVVIICAHYDSISEDPYNRAPGANDNASGTAGVLTAASILRNFRFERTVEFCLFSWEEFGLFGSQAYAEECLETGKIVVDVINMDMILHPTNDAQPRLPLDVDIITNGPSQKLANRVRSSMVWYTTLDSEITTNTVEGSDHAPFWHIGANAVAVTDNTPDEIWSGATTVYHTTDDLVAQPNADLPFALSVARGVAAAAMVRAEWEPSSALPFGATTYAEVDGVPGFDDGEHQASVSLTEGLIPDGAIAECHAENLVLQATAAAWAGRTHEALCHSNSFETFVPRSATIPEGQEVPLELTIQGSGEFLIDRKLRGLYAHCRVEVWARSAETFPLFDGTVSLSFAGAEISGDFVEEDFSLESTSMRKEAVLTDWTKVISFTGKIGQPVTLCARLSQMAYAFSGGKAECRWTDPLRLSVAGADLEVWPEIAGFAAEPRVSEVSTDGVDLTMTWQPFSQGMYTVERSEDLLSWTPIATTPFTIWRTGDWASSVGFFRVRSE